MPEHTTTKLNTVRARSLELLETSQHSSGAFPAALNYPVYKYCWFRDGSFIADAVSRTGDPDQATRFHVWCCGVIESRRDQIVTLNRLADDGETISGDQMLPTRYALDGTNGNEIWWDYQLDGYGTWLWSLDSHLKRHDVSAAPFREATELIAGYLGRFGDQRCYDWWEEHENRQHVSTIAAVVAGLEAATQVTLDSGDRTAVSSATRLREIVLASAAPNGYLTKWIGSDAVDGSLLSAVVPFGVVTPGSDIAEATYERIVATILNHGVYRYLGDTFYGGGEWLILTAWLGWYEVATGRIELAETRRAWIVDQATPSGDLPEQASTDMQHPERLEEWQQKWGPVATPLLWSHAMFLILDDAIEHHRDTR